VPASSVRYNVLNRAPPSAPFRQCFSLISIRRRQPFAFTAANTFRKCEARGCLKRATLIAEKIDVAGRHVRQIELCSLHCEVVIERERARGLEISDRRNE